jgi:tetratricopeptide (TPR) repeat protein
MAFALRATLKQYYDWDWDGARRDFRRAVRLAPGSADAAAEYAFFLYFANEPDSALAYARRAVSLDPSNSLLRGGLGRIFAFSGMLDSALAASRQALELDSLQWTADYARVNALLALGRRTEAESAAAHYRRFAAGKPALALLADYYRRTGNLSGAREILEEILDLSREQYVSPAKIGAVRLALGDRAGALDALEESMRNRDLSLIPDIVLLYSSLAGDPRFEAVRHRVFGSRPVPRNPFP